MSVSRMDSVSVSDIGAEHDSASELSAIGDVDEDLSMLNRFETEEDFFAAMSETNSLYFLMERRLIFAEKSLHQAHAGGQVEKDVAAAQTAPLLQDGESVIYMKQRGEGIQHLVDSTGGPVYDAAICLSRYIAAEEADKLVGKNVIELGAGPGLVSVIASRLVGEGGFVLCTDGTEATVDLINENLVDAKGAKPSNAAGAKFWWGTEPEEVVSRSWDYVLASDVAYDEHIFDDLLLGLRTIMKPGTVGLLCNGTRAPAAERQLRQLLEAEYALTVINVAAMETSEELLAPEEEEGASAQGRAGGNLKLERRKRVMPRKMNMWRITCK